MKNENGVYLDYETETVAMHGRAYAQVNIAKCDDDLFRFSIGVSYSYGGFSGPITDHDEGFPTAQQAKTAAVTRLLERWPQPWESEPESIHKELRVMREQIEAKLRQPVLL